MEHAGLVAHAATIQARLDLRGPWFAQFREDADGVPRLMEVNARVGGSSGASRLAGVNVPLMCLLSFAGVDVVAPRRIAPLTVVRKLDRVGNVDDFDIAIWDLDDTLVLHDGDVDPDAAAALFRLRNGGRRQWLVSRNIDPAAAAARACLPPVFEDIVRADDSAQAKVDVVRSILASTSTAPSRCLMINDSTSERLLFERELPEVRTFGPDAVGALWPRRSDDQISSVASRSR